MTPRHLAAVTLLSSLSVTVGAIWIIQAHYQRTLQRELAESSGQVGQLRVQAEALRVEQAERRRELEVIKADIAQAETALSAAQAAAEDSQCLATHARVDAAVTLEQVRCYEQYAEQAGCVAANERERSDNTMLGVLAGAGLAIMTGGSSVLLTAGGGLVGASSSGSQQCPTPECTLDTKELRRKVLTEQDLGELPQCRKEYESAFLVDTVEYDDLDDFEPEPGINGKARRPLKKRKPRPRPRKSRSRR